MEVHLVESGFAECIGGPPGVVANRDRPASWFVEGDHVGAGADGSLSEAGQIAGGCGGLEHEPEWGPDQLVDEPGVRFGQLIDDRAGVGGHHGDHAGSGDLEHRRLCGRLQTPHRDHRVGVERGAVVERDAVAEFDGPDGEVVVGHRRRGCQPRDHAAPDAGLVQRFEHGGRHGATTVEALVGPRSERSDAIGHQDVEDRGVVGDDGRVRRLGALVDRCGGGRRQRVGDDRVDAGGVGFGVVAVGAGGEQQCPSREEQDRSPSGEAPIVPAAHSSSSIAYGSRHACWDSFGRSGPFGSSPSASR